MKILFLTDNFPPEVNAPATRTFEHCKKWVELGYEVTIITCFPNFPKGKVFDGYKNSLYKSEIIEGIKVIRVWSYITENNGFIKRIIDYISYSISSFIVGLFVKTDIIIATSPQFFTAISGRLLSFFKQKKWIMEVRDLWPDSIVAVGSLTKSSIIFKTLKRIENQLYKSAFKIIVVTDSFKEYLMNSHEIQDNKIGVFKNGVISDKYIHPQEDDLYELKTLLDIREKIIISYVGTHGLAHGLKFILECISKIEDSKYHFLFIGDGAEKSNLIRFSKESNIKNCTFLDSIPKEEIPKYIGISDYSLVNLKKSDEFKNVIPSKIFENIAMYKPILLGVEGESKTLIEKYKVGVTFEPENETSFIMALKDIQQINIPEFKRNCDKMLSEFDRNVIAERMISFINNNTSNKLVVNFKNMNKHSLLSQLENLKNTYLLGLTSVYLLNNYTKDDDFKNSSCAFGKYSFEFTQIENLFKSDSDKKIAINEFMKLFYRALLKEGFELVKTYSNQNKQFEKLRTQPWYEFARIIRNSISHNFKFDLSKIKPESFPITWNKRIINQNLNGEYLKIEFLGYEGVWELFHEFITFSQNELK